MSSKEYPVDVLIPSFDGFSDIWWIADTLFRRHWPDREWPMYWISNRLPPPAGNHWLPVEPDRGFSGNILSIIDGMAEAILMWMDECFLLGPAIDNEMMLTAARLFYENDSIAAVRLSHYHGGPSAQYKDGFGLIPKHAGGRVSTQPILWRRRVLRHLLCALPVSSEFETTSKHVLNAAFPDMLVISPFKGVRHCADSLRRGFWRRCAPRHFEEESLDVDIEQRGLCKLIHDGGRCLG